jgi:hypothetical protein
MNTDYLAAFGTGPLFFFVLNEPPDTMFLYVTEIVNHAHAVIFPIPIIQAAQNRTRETFTPDAMPVITARYEFAGLYFAPGAGFHFKIVVPPAPGTWVFDSHVGSAKTTVHSARCN